MNIQKTFVKPDTAKRIAEGLFPDAAVIQVIEHSYDNIVVLVDGMYALRFPRDSAAYARSQHEKLILQQLDLKQLQSVTVPKILGEHDNPPYLLTTFMHGQHLSSQAIRDLPEALQVAFGETVARFAYELHSSVPLNMEIRLRQQLQLDGQDDEPWEIYFKKRFKQHSFQTPLQDNIAKEYYQRWMSGPTEPLVVVHDDLHTENMFFVDNRLVGVLDFGDTNIGIAEQELRQLYRINETVLDAALNAYNKLAGRLLDVETIKLWCIMQELGVFSHMLSSDQTNHRIFARACNNLNRWHPEGKWGDGITLTDKMGYQ